MAPPIDNKSSDEELDDLVRAAMKTLDGEVPSGYFEGLPNRTLARLEDSSMQTTSGTSGSSSLGTESVPMGDLGDSTQPNKKEREEDSGLHDIRNLAASSRSRRLSSRRLGTNPPAVDEDILASTSGSWKSIALPEPAKMVSLPEIADLPSKAEIKAMEKAAKAEAKARKSRPSGEMVPPADIAPSSSAPSLPVVAKGADAPMTLEEETPSAKPATEAPAFGSRISGMKPAKVTPIGEAPKKKTGLILGSIGAVVAAAAGVVIYVSMDKKNADTASAPALSEGASDRSRAEPPKAAPTPTVNAIATDDQKKTDEPKKDDAGAGSAAVAEPPPVADPTPAKPVVKVPAVKSKKPEPKKIIEVTPPPDDKVSKKPTKVEPPKGKSEVKESDPDFDQLIKDSGYKKKEDKPKLDKKELNATDFRKGMGAVQAKAMACYNGTEGTAMVKIFIAPSGSITNVVVSGQFANTPVAGCITAAVKGASFPAWDGPPASFNYSYLLAN